MSFINAATSSYIWRLNIVYQRSIALKKALSPQQPGFEHMKHRMIVTANIIKNINVSLKLVTSQSI